MGNSIFDDRRLYSEEESSLIKDQAKIFDLILDVINSKIFNPTFIRKYLKINHRNFKYIIHGRISKFTLEFLQEREPLAQQLIDIIELLKSQEN